MQYLSQFLGWHSLWISWWKHYRKLNDYLFNPRPTKGGWLPPTWRIFSLLPQNGKESDVSHDNLKYIICGHLNEILAYISLKIGYVKLAHDYDVSVASYLGGW